MIRHRLCWSLAALLLAVGPGCALVGGVDGTFDPIGGTTTGSGGGTPATCIDGVKNGTETDVDCGGDTCSLCADGQKCTASKDCESNYCAGGTCHPSSCKDGIKNGTETDVDCGGGACPPCGDGKACGAPGQCESLVCTKGICAAPSCSDGVKNGDESFVDCGPTCPCSTGQPCMVADDCKSLLCDQGFCQPAACNDGILDGSESQVDCGGACPGCPDMANCNSGDDCQSGVCNAKKCQPGTCSDGVKNGNETDVDCGTACGKPCGNGEACSVAGDCKSGVCVVGQCVASTCVDGIKNGSETSVDCGGGCLCDDGATCASAADCKSDVCVGSVCQAPTCSDGVTNGAETDQDCGGSCPPCSSGKTCQEDGDCKSGVCTAHACVASSCSDGLQNGSETDVDCGGSCGPCAPDKLCTVDADCVGGACVGGVCAPTCTDGVKNQGESDVDCGGPMCPACGQGKDCNDPGDCKTHVCQGTCKASTCTDGLKGGDESDVDCGGSCGACDNAKGCNFDEDCLSGGCDAGTCGVWVRAYGPTDGPNNRQPALAIEPDGTIVGKQLVDSPGIDFGGGTQPPPNGLGAATALFALSQTGQYAWEQFAENKCSALGLTLKSDVAGNVILVGSAPGGCDFGGGSIAASGLFVAKYSSSGNYTWAKVFGPPNVYLPTQAVALAPNGDIILTGSFDGSSLTFGSHTLTNPNPGSLEGFVARVAADGNPLWAVTLGAVAGNSEGIAAAVDSAGNVFVTGDFDISIDLGGSCAALGGGFQGFVAKLSSTGTCIWAETAGNTGVSSIAVDASDDVIVVGQSGNEVTLGGADLVGPAGVWTMRLHGGNGSSLWANSVQPLFSSVAVPALALDPAGNAILAGSFPNGTSPDFGGGALVNHGGNDVFVAAYAHSDGHHLFSRAFGGADDDEATDVATDPTTGNVLVTGFFQDAVDFGTGPIAAQSPYSTFVLSLGPVP